MGSSTNALMLQKVIEKTHLLLRLYYNKQQWRHIHPLLAQLSEAYIKLYQANPLSLNAQLHLFIKSHGYTTNLVVNQIVIVLAICKRLKYSNKVTSELISSCLANYLCVTNESNTKAQGLALSTQAKRQWQFRHHLAIKLLDKSSQAHAEVKHILMRLDKYQQALNYPELVNLYDLKSIIVSLADLIAQQITPQNSQKPPLSLKACLAGLYLKSQNLKVRQVLKSIVEELQYPFQGLITKYKGYNAFCISRSGNTTELCVVNNAKQFQRINTRQNLAFRDKPVTLSDPTLIYAIWFIKNTSAEIPVSGDAENKIIETATGLGKHEYVSYSQLEKAISDNKQLVERLLLAASQYNKQQKKAGDLRHSLTMVGLNNASLMCQRVLLEQGLEDYAHPLMAEVLSRYETTKKVINAYVALQTHYHFEEITSPFTAYIYYLLSTYQDIKWAIPSINFDEQLVPFSYACIFGVNDVDNRPVCEAIKSNFSFSASHKAFISSERSDKQEQLGLARAMIFIKLTTYSILKPEVPVSAWQKGLIKEQINLLGLPDYASFIDKIISQAPYNPI